MKKPKLTDVELSKVLSRAAVGLLQHATYGRGGDGGPLENCGCVAGTVYDSGVNMADATGCSAEEFLLSKNAKARRAKAISDAVWPDDGERWDYGGDPDSVLRRLEKCGVVR